MKNLLVILTSFISLVSFSQTVLMGQAGYPESSPAPCSTFGTAGANFFDDAGAADYSANFNDTTVFCPDLSQGSKMSILFDVNEVFVVDASDFIYIFDGPTTASPLVETINSVTHPAGYAFTASFANTSGCITVVFVSDGAIEGAGWEAIVTCGYVPQPFESHMEAFINGAGSNVLNPLDTGFVDICFGDSILLVATPIFPLSLENNGVGYSQTRDNVNYTWNISDGGTYPDNDSVWFTPPNRFGYIVDLLVSDQLLVTEQLIAKVRVSQLPSFANVGPFNDSICLGETTVLIGGVTSTDTAGINIPPSTYQLGGSFAGTTYLPDGSGAQYQAPVTISGFPTGSTISNSQDLNQVCITIEHSFVGDLEIALECPNGTQVTLLNSYSPGFIAGGQSGGNLNLGAPLMTDDSGSPGDGWEYCFSSVYATWGDYPTEFAAGNFIPTPSDEGGESLNPDGVFLPEDDFSAFAGCPVNGDWTIIVQDNIFSDDGFIFEWGLFFDASFFGLSGYNNIVVDDYWTADPTIVSGQADTALVVQPTSDGINTYTYNITDDFGCDYDTTVALYVLPQPIIFNDTIVCSFGMTALNTSSYDGGIWSSADPLIHFNDSSLANPFIYTDTLAGLYTVTYTDNECGTSVSSTIDFPEYPGTWLVDTILCEGITYDFDALNDNTYATTYTWSDGTTGENILVTEEGDYILDMTNLCYVVTDTLTVGYKRCDIEAPNVISLAQGSQNPLWYADTEGLKSFEVIITNRWGNVIYECSDELGNCYWDGRDRKGVYVDEGTYFYIINAETQGNEELNKHGFIQVVK